MNADLEKSRLEYNGVSPGWRVESAYWPLINADER
jgi:hypothetical protein